MQGGWQFPTYQPGDLIEVDHQPALMRWTCEHGRQVALTLDSENAVGVRGLMFMDCGCVWPARPPEAAAVLTSIERAMQAVDDLCQGRINWTMRVPAEPDRDPDLIISDALRAARAYVEART